MYSRELKFKRHHFDFNGDYIQTTEWGIFDYGFRSPSSLSNENKDKFIDCQFTGLKDKNGFDIYEGDWLLICSGYTSFVSYEDGMFVSIYKHPEDGEIIPLLDAIGKETEIIGNIHNPHKKP